MATAFLDLERGLSLHSKILISGSVYHKYIVGSWALAKDTTLPWEVAMAKFSMYLFGGMIIGCF